MSENAENNDEKLRTMMFRGETGDRGEKPSQETEPGDPGTICGDPRETPWAIMPI